MWFCEPWPHPFGLAGLEGFLHYFLVTIRAYDGYLDIEPPALARASHSEIHLTQSRGPRRQTHSRAVRRCPVAAEPPLILLPERDIGAVSASPVVLVAAVFWPSPKRVWTSSAFLGVTILALLWEPLAGATMHTLPGTPRHPAAEY